MRRSISLFSKGKARGQSAQAPRNGSQPLLSTAPSFLRATRLLEAPPTRFHLLHNASTLVVTLVVTRRATVRQKATPGDTAEATEPGFRHKIDVQRRETTPSDRRLMAS